MANEEAWTLLSIGLAFIGLRVYVRWTQVGPASFDLDDYLMPLAGLVFALETVAAYLVGALFDGLTNSYMTDAERAALDPASEEYFNRQWGSKIQVIGWSFYAFILWAIKFCLTAFYGRLTSGLMHLRLRVRIAYGLLIATYLLVALGLLLSCQPMHKFWQINPDPGALCKPTNSPFYVLVVVIPNVLTDLYLLSIPLPLLWKVNISVRRKVTLMGLFSGAIFVIMAGTIRAVVISTSGPEGAVTGSQWACRETFVAIIVSNLPVVQPFLRKHASKIGLSALFSSKRGTTGGPSMPLDSNPGQSRGNKRTGGRSGVGLGYGGNVTVASVHRGGGGGGTTAAAPWASDEYILEGTHHHQSGQSPPGSGGMVDLERGGSPPKGKRMPADSKDIIVSHEVTVVHD